MIYHMISVIFYFEKKNRQLWVRLNWISRDGIRAFPQNLIDEIKRVSNPFSKPEELKNENSRDEGVLAKEIEKRIKISEMKLLESVDHNTLVTGRCTLNWINTGPNRMALPRCGR